MATSIPPTMLLFLALFIVPSMISSTSPQLSWHKFQPAAIYDQCHFTHTDSHIAWVATTSINPPPALVLHNPATSGNPSFIDSGDPEHDVLIASTCQTSRHHGVVAYTVNRLFLSNSSSITQLKILDAENPKNPFVHLVSTQNAVTSHHASQVSKNGDLVVFALTQIVDKFTHFVQLYVFEKNSHGQWQLGLAHKYKNLTISIDIELSSDGSHCAINGGEYLLVVSTKTGNIFWSESLPKAQMNGNSIAFSENADFFAYGEADLFVLAKNSHGVYQNWFTIPGMSEGRLIGAIEIARRDLAVAWFSLNFDHNTVTVYELPDKKPSSSPKPVFTWSAPSVKGPYQDMPVALRMHPDKRMFVVGSWGTNTSSATPTVNLVDARSEHNPIWSFTTPGSVFDVGFACDKMEERCFLSAVGKHEHANVMGLAGDAYLWSFDS